MNDMSTMSKPRLAPRDKSSARLAALKDLVDREVGSAIEMTRAGGRRWVVMRVHVVDGEVSRDSAVERAALGVD